MLQRDPGVEFLNALLHQITQLLSIKQVFNSGFRPCLNGATERSHWFLNSALGSEVSPNKRNGSNFYNQLFILIMFPQFQALLIAHLSF